MFKWSMCKLTVAILLIMTCLVVSEASAQWDGVAVYNVRAFQRAGTNLVDIYYDFITVEWVPATITAHLSLDGGASYTIQCVTVSGDVGPGIAPGVERHIVWDAAVDYPGYSGDDCQIRVTASAPGSDGVFVLIPGGTFRMGSEGEGGGSDEVIHWVTVGSFYVSRIEVTQSQYAALMGGDVPYPSRPVASVSWFDAVRYCNALSLAEGLTPCYSESDWTWNQGANGYRLLTESEWEYACRAGSQTRYCNGDAEADLAEVGWYNANSGGHAHDVQTKDPSLWGLYDMHGNIWEWCWDWYQAYPSGTIEDPHVDDGGPTSGSARVIRGGYFFSNASNCRSAARDYGNPSYPGNYVGFRVARSAD